jgi:hypothetical protein
LAGLLTITLARPGIARVASNHEARDNLVRAFILRAEDRIVINVPQ